jgi:anti-anti-sigma factor
MPTAIQRERTIAPLAGDKLAMKLSMVSIEQGGMILVSAEGNITVADVDPSRKNPLEALLGATWFNNRVLLNMANIAYIDSSAIGWLMNSHTSFKGGGGILVIHNLQKTIREMLGMLRLDRVLHIADTEEAARKLVESGGKK